MRVKTATGERSIVAPSSGSALMGIPAGCRRPDRLAPFLSVATSLLIPVAASARRVAAAASLFGLALEYWGLSLADVTPAVVCAFVVLRCAPPFGASNLPRRFDVPVLPVTAGGDIDLLRRGSRLGLGGLEAVRGVLQHELVSGLLSSIGARIKKIRSAKKPVLYREVLAYCRICRMTDTAISLRDGFALVLAFTFGMRISELLQLRGRHLKVVVLRDRPALQVTFANVKNRRSVFSTHDPYVVTAQHPLLMEMLDRFRGRVGLEDERSVFHVLRAGKRTELTRDWFAGVVREAAPGDRTPHSCRVGMATELWAAGVPLQKIMALGRWRSLTALLYIIGNVDETLDASSCLGRAGLRASAEGLRRALGCTMPRDAVPEVDADRWEVCAGVASDEE